MSTLINEIKYAFRQLGRDLAFTTVAVLTLGLGIGATTSLFSVFNALVLDPFPYPESDRIAYVWSGQSWSLSALDYFDIKEQMTSFADMGVYQAKPLNFGGEKPESLCAVHCTSGVLRVLGMHPILGRLLDESDEQPGAEPVAVIGHALWTRSLAADPQVSVSKEPDARVDRRGGWFSRHACLGPPIVQSAVSAQSVGSGYVRRCHIASDWCSVASLLSARTPCGKDRSDGGAQI